ncbi:MAG TPA: hypothetical protein VH143_07700 [Kofleriaceae bacterium]|jgi:hypothetical protein|nr:hypothetical protein [Kofleriaceae bacterium]
MSPLAIKIYRTLRHRLARKEPAITYRALAAEVSEMHPRDPRFHAALTEVADACRHAKLPCLPAIVWRADKKRPSDGYYKVAHPNARTDDNKRTAWQREHARVLAASFPARL